MHRRTQFRFLCAGTLAAIGIAAPLCVFPACTAAQKYGTVSTFKGGGGGAPWDDQSLAANGAISKIEVWGGRYVDAVRVTYGSNASVIHGGSGVAPGGTLTTIPLAQGEYILMVDGQAGDYVDNLCFTKNNQTRICTGGGGGAAFQMSDNGKALRYLAGNSGTYVDRIGAAFESYSEVDPNSVHSDMTAMKQAVQSAQRKVTKQTLVNNLDIAQRQEFDERQIVTSSSSTNWSNSQTITQQHQVGGEFSYSPPATTGGVGGKVSYSYTNTNSSTNASGGATADSTSQSYGVVVHVKVPAHSKVVATTSWKQMSYTIPITYDIVYYSDAQKTQVICREATVSQLKGVQSFGVKTTFGK
jgi:hypothetical protein